TTIGLAVALADRLDSIVGLFAVGLVPSGTSDPYGLRRAAVGIVQIALGRKLDLDLRELIDWASLGYTRDLGENFVTDDAKTEALAFIIGRERVVLRETFNHDVVEAVLAEQGHNPYRAAEHARQLSVWIKSKGWENILDAYARCARITRNQDETYVLRPDDFAEQVELNLVKAYQEIAADLSRKPDLDEMLTAFEKLVPKISAFFAPATEGGVLVMDPDPDVRANRLALLQHIVAMADGVADFSQLEGF
ncbi:MAG: glycine--tRNA ligase subunit beta, partial [Chloroflexi bacterium]|nr:glycine--tRNA ligase subunit beta [Chloroflexota bacterium]